MAPQELVRDAVERVVISGHEGRSGAGLERVRLADGRRLFVERIDPASDFTLALTRGAPGRTLTLLSALLWLGRTKALDAVEHPDPPIRARERADPYWWVVRARTALERGIV